MPPAVFPEMVLAMTVMVPLLSMPAPTLSAPEFFVMVLSMMVMVLSRNSDSGVWFRHVSVPRHGAIGEREGALGVVDAKRPVFDGQVVESYAGSPGSTVTTGPLAVPSRAAGRPAGPPGQVVMVTGDLMARWSSIVPETSMVAPEAALVRA